MRWEAHTKSLTTYAIVVWELHGWMFWFYAAGSRVTKIVHRSKPDEKSDSVTEDLDTKLAQEDMRNAHFYVSTSVLCVFIAIHYYPWCRTAVLRSFHQVLKSPLYTEVLEWKEKLMLKCSLPEIGDQYLLHIILHCVNSYKYTIRIRIKFPFRFHSRKLHRLGRKKATEPLRYCFRNYGSPISI